MKRMLPLAMLMAAGALLASDPNVGTWKLNVAKSKFSPGPGPQEPLRLWCLTSPAPRWFCL
jgi:hypothetical protein